jgi:hypothetical protein
LWHSLNSMRLPRRIILRFLALLLATTAFLPIPAQTQEASSTEQWSSDVNSLADKIFAALGTSRSVSLDLKNISALDAAAVAAIEKQLQAELIRRGLQVASEISAETPIQVTFSQGVAGYIWVAQIHKKQADQVVMVRVHGRQENAASANPPPVLRSSAIWRQQSVILDFTSGVDSHGLPILFLLESDRLSLLQRDGDTWAIRDSATISHTHPWPRALRGRLVVSATEFKALLPGVSCMGGWSVGLIMDCQADAQDPSFGVTENQPTFLGWGDDAVSISAGCGRSEQALVTGTGDWSRPDHIQFYEVTNGQASPMGQPMEFPGPILALWPGGDGKSARAVSRNLQTGMYEASIVSVACGN